VIDAADAGHPESGPFKFAGPLLGILSGASHCGFEGGVRRAGAGENRVSTTECLTWVTLVATNGWCVESKLGRLFRLFSLQVAV